jgi:hypothetical protein
VVISCLDSYDYIQSIRQLQHGENLTDIDRFLLFTCWEHIPFASTMSRKSFNGPNSVNFIQYVYDTLLERLERALDEPPPVAPPSFGYIFERFHQLLNIHNLQSFDKHTPYIIDHLTKILQNSPAPNTDDDVIVLITLEAFYSLSKNADICAVMKKRQLVPLFKKYVSTNTGEKRKLAFDILAEIMDEQEINTHSSKITAFFIDELKHLDPNGYNPDVDNALSSLKGMVFREK